MLAFDVPTDGTGFRLEVIGGGEIRLGDDDEVREGGG
jgi:hypothetical protein